MCEEPILAKVLTAMVPEYENLHSGKLRLSVMSAVTSFTPYFGQDILYYRLNYCALFYRKNVYNV